MRQKKSILDAYLNTGKILNQCLREGLPLSQSFSSPLLLSYLFSGREGLADSSLSHAQLMQAILDHDSGYAGNNPLCFALSSSLRRNCFNSSIHLSFGLI